MCIRDSLYCRRSYFLYQKAQSLTYISGKFLPGLPDIEMCIRDSMKDDHMRNAQLKPGYNVQIAVDSEYIVAADIFRIGMMSRH